MGWAIFGAVILFLSLAARSKLRKEEENLRVNPPSPESEESSAQESKDIRDEDSASGSTQ